MLCAPMNAKPTQSTTGAKTRAQNGWQGERYVNIMWMQDERFIRRAFFEVILTLCFVSKKNNVGLNEKWTLKKRGTQGKRFVNAPRFSTVSVNGAENTVNARKKWESRTFPRLVSLLSSINKICIRKSCV